MGQSISSKMQHSSIESEKTAYNAVMMAQKRAVKVRQKASFGNSSSGYELWGWKSLLEDSKASSKSLSPTYSLKSDFNWKKAARKTSETTLCPNSQPDKDNALVFGVVSGTVKSPKIDYLKRSQPVNEIVPPSAVKPTEMLRIASDCHKKGCLHFDGADCRLAARIVEQLPTVTDTLPACQICSSCRWWQQKGKSACLRCPQVVTKNYYASSLFEQVANPQAITQIRF
ncbi:hypothetical protein [Pleurocapsa sp. FMAR1]|uniref:hypothetical protein n=1 Tax=Pleurocapsa sp. FMAR1 TaxID=3040204 RepID=UPI0029C63718|nr:hypothetical protein [Pleurocapsa sp. FMAR1]